MNAAIRWSPRAVSDIENHLNYLQKEWSSTVVVKMLNRIEEVLNSISDNPKLYSSFNVKRKIHRCVITSHITLYYPRKERVVELITFWDTRQNPEKLNL